MSEGLEARVLMFRGSEAGGEEGSEYRKMRWRGCCGEGLCVGGKKMDGKNISGVEGAWVMYL